MGEEELLQPAHLAQVRNGIPQSRQLPGEIRFQILHRVELHHIQDVTVSLQHCKILQLLTAKVQQISPLIDFLHKIAEGLIKDTFLEAKVN